MTNSLKLKVIERDGSVRQVEGVAEGSLLSLLRDAGVDEIAALCGGNCACATCHVYVEAATILPEPDLEEREMLDTLVYQEPQSRLACQLTVSDRIEWLKVTIAPEE
ncbi:2Fe-2S iron-sulfur cluster-binding protein [uncultured Hoeflea sp.]|uniref:2Fe-2S iron-sulfur cluster-binding protein n=1 Tax=uncultured Hoeflea sp. TaxID=538666 RepID=UPI0030D7FEC3